MKHTIFTVFLTISILVSSCEKQEFSTESNSDAPILPAEFFNYSDLKIPMQLSGHPALTGLNLKNLPPDFEQRVDIPFNEQRFSPPSNKEIPEITDAGATLGRVLFYDKGLSINNSIACGSCHIQSKGFADSKALSLGFAGKRTSRNSMAIVNPFMNENMFWDSRTPSIKKLILQPVQHHIEMGMESLEYLNAKLGQRGYYPSLFAQAFGTEDITSERISEAIAQFMCSMVSFESKNDLYERGDAHSLNSIEQMGRSLFFSAELKCSQCHAGPNFAAEDFPGGEYGTVEAPGAANIGLDFDSNDKGINGKFRIPSLRNIALTAPYMHDGRFNTLDEVIEHYNSSIQSHPALDNKLKDKSGLPQRLNLDVLEKRALIAFLNSLTDENFISDEKFSNPFTSK